MGFRTHLDAVLRTDKGERVLDEALRLARDPLAKQRIVELRDKLAAPPAAAAGRATPPRDRD